MLAYCYTFCLLLAINAIHYTEARHKREIYEEGYRAPPSAILTHKQDVTNDGVFNYVFAADNGLKQGESISPDGTRTGAYQYIDPSGKTISVKYMAGKDGFRIIEGDHIPTQPKPVEPIPEYQPPEYREKLEKKNMKFKVPVKDYDDEEKGYYQQKKNNWQQQQQKYQQPKYEQQRPQYEQQRPQYEQQRPQYEQQRPQYEQQRSQFEQERFQQQQHQPKTQYHQNDGHQRNNQAQNSRAMLYNVEQRHDANYRKYLDNGQAADGNDNQQPQRAHFNGGYNFEIKG